MRYSAGAARASLDPSGHQKHWPKDPTGRRSITASTHRLSRLAIPSADPAWLGHEQTCNRPRIERRFAPGLYKRTEIPAEPLGQQEAYPELFSTAGAKRARWPCIGPLATSTVERFMTTTLRAYRSQVSFFARRYKQKTGPGGTPHPPRTPLHANMPRQEPRKARAVNPDATSRIGVLRPRPRFYYNFSIPGRADPKPRQALDPRLQPPTNKSRTTLQPSRRAYLTARCRD